MKILQADNIRYNLQPILRETDGVVGFLLAYNNDLINRELKVYDEKRNELINKYMGEEKNESKFIEEIRPLAEVEIELNFKKINEDDLIQSKLKADAVSFLMNIGMVNFKEN